MAQQIPVIDLFAGPGGLAEGFASFARLDGIKPFRIAVSVEKDPAAHSTLLLRSFFRQFELDEVPEHYYQYLRGELSRDQLFECFPKQADSARKEAWHFELGTDQQRTLELDAAIRERVGHRDDWVLIGGPPCQAYSLAGRARNRGVDGYLAEADGRHFLYREYLRVISVHWPAVFIMENVKGILSSTVSNARIFEQIVQDLADPLPATGKPRASRRRYRIVPLCSPALGGRVTNDRQYSPHEYVVKCEQYGIPQNRHRVILVGIRDDIDLGRMRHLAPSKPVSSNSIIGGLPKLRSGLSTGHDDFMTWTAALHAALSSPWYAQLESCEAGHQMRQRIAEVVALIPTATIGRGSEFASIDDDVANSRLSNWIVDRRLKGVCNSSTRSHMEGDLHRYLFAATFAEVHGVSPKISNFPAALLPAHKNIQTAVKGGLFEDRFRVQVAGRPATTITSHIAKDGHYYIHYDPSQCRSLTVREAARLQTFPDNYFFEGNRTQQYSQVGNAVPPFLAAQVSQVVDNLLK